ncbi:hypothetical protein BDW67DRAFT_169606 [Aspergillus spinulosporus]
MYNLPASLKSSPAQRAEGRTLWRPVLSDGDTGIWIHCVSYHALADSAHLPALYAVACIVALLCSAPLPERPSSLMCCSWPKSELIYVELTSTQWISYIVRTSCPEASPTIPLAPYIDSAGLSKIG